jgi:hypothetical protein
MRTGRYKEVFIMAKKTTQRDIILWHLRNVGTLTRAQAMGEYGIVELPARIVELKKLGHKITSEKGTSTNRFGKVHFNIYKLEEPHNEQPLL